jgi:hypothetical protein
MVRRSALKWGRPEKLFGNSKFTHMIATKPFTPPTELTRTLLFKVIEKEKPLLMGKEVKRRVLVVRTVLNGATAM